MALTTKAMTKVQNIEDDVPMGECRRDKDGRGYLYKFTAKERAELKKKLLLQKQQGE